MNTNNSVNKITNFVMAKVVNTPEDNTPERELLLQMIKGLGQQLSLFNMAYFSTTNRNNIQNAIRRKVHELSQNSYIISPQSDQELMIIMRQIYIEHSMHFEDIALIRKEIQKLNNIVVDKSVVMIIRSIAGYMKFLADQASPLTLLEPPKNTTNAGKRGEELFPLNM